jgi:type IV pilus assembly protein PilQ
MFNKLIKLNLALFMLTFVFAQQSVFANDKTPADSEPLKISDISIKTVGDITEAIIVANQSVTAYQDNTVAGTDSVPTRMYIDIASAAIGTAKNEYPVGTILDKIRIAPSDKGVRVVFDSSSSEIFSYTIASDPQGLKVTISPAAANAKTNVDDNTLDQLIDSSVAELEKQPLNAAAQDTDKKTGKDNFKVSGFDKERISVDFYKIDLHNVFRLFREVSGMNIIVDEKVKGTLTLSLSDVPWDFALDIVLNLSGLKKEERFNTIVIYPASSSFSWPERTSLDNLEIETDSAILDQETLIVQQSANQSKEIMQAQQIISEAKKAEQQKNFEDAAQSYEQALKLWPDNAKLSNHLVTLYLVELGMNAKAVYHAANTLKNDPQNYKAALYAAIASANMQEKAEAMEYFNQSVSGNPPMQAALISYAAFNEQNKLYDEALKLLEKHDEYYGESSSTMLSKARIFDKLGESDKATQQYSSLLSSGYQLTPDLKKYIKGRLSAGNIQN